MQTREGRRVEGWNERGKREREGGGGAGRRKREKERGGKRGLDIEDGEKERWK